MIYLIKDLKIGMLVNGSKQTTINYRKLGKKDFVRILKTRKVIKRVPKVLKPKDMILTKNHLMVQIGG